MQLTVLTPTTLHQLDLPTDSFSVRILNEQLLSQFGKITKLYTDNKWILEVTDGQIDGILYSREELESNLSNSVEQRANTDYSKIIGTTKNNNKLEKNNKLNELEKNNNKLENKLEDKFNIHSQPCSTHGPNAMCLNCQPVDAYDSRLLQKRGVKYCSFRAYCLFIQHRTQQSNKNILNNIQQDNKQAVPPSLTYHEQCDCGNKPYGKYYPWNRNNIKMNKSEINTNKNNEINTDRKSVV